MDELTQAEIIEWELNILKFLEEEENKLKEEEENKLK
jgi:hypothetical protein